MKPKFVSALSKSMLPAAAWMVLATSANAGVLYTFAGPQLVDEDPFYAPTDNTTVSKSATDTGTLYFKYTLTNPGSYTTGVGSSGEFYAGMSLFNGVGGFGGAEGPGIGKAWGYGGYSSFGNLGNNDFKSANGQSGPGTWQPISSTDTTTFVFRIDFNANANDNVTVWVNPDLNLSEAAQSASLKTSLSGDCTFDRLYLREGGAGSGWTYSNVAIAENATDAGFFAAPLTTSTWDGGGGDSNWSTAANWVGDTAPVAGFDLVFPFSANTSPVNDLTVGTAFTGLNFDSGATSYTFTGNAIGISNFVRNTSVNPQEVDLPLQLNGPLALDALNSTLFIGGAISGPHGITKTGNLVDLTANNTYTGDTTIATGTLSIGDGDVTGSIDPTGTVAFGAGATTRLEIYRSDDVTMGNPITTGGRANIAAQGGGKVNLTGPITGAGEFWTYGPGTVQITPNAGSAAFSPTIVNQSGVLEVEDFSTGTLGTSLFCIGQGGSGTLRYTGPTASTDRVGPFALQGVGTNSFIEISTPATELTFTVPLDDNNPFGPKGLTKTGPGTLVLGVAHVYDGDTVVEEGKLRLTQPGFADTSTVTVLEGGAKLDLDFVGSDTVTGIVLGPDVLPPGTICTAISHPDYISGTGSLVIPSNATPYETWGSTYGLAAGSEDGDLDNDGLSNFEEYSFGLIPNSGSSVNPIALQLDKTAGAFSYTRRLTSLTGLTYSVWYSTDLATWTVDTGATEGTPVVNGEVETVPVTLTGSLLTNPKLFIQVRAE